MTEFNDPALKAIFQRRQTIDAGRSIEVRLGAEDMAPHLFGLQCRSRNCGPHLRHCDRHRHLGRCGVAYRRDRSGVRNGTADHLRNSGRAHWGSKRRWVRRSLS